MVEPSTAVKLGPRVEQILSAIPDRAFSERLRKVYLAAEAAVARLVDLDMTRYEQLSGDESPDLSLWNEMAPFISDTLMGVNALLQVLREEFLIKPQPLAGQAMEVDRVLREGASTLSQEVTRLGETMRSPQVVSDRWNLLAELQGFRARYRETIGELVFSSLSAYGEVTRSEVVPGYQAELQAAISARSVGADLRRLMKVRLEKVRHAEREDVQWNAQQLEKEMEFFSKTHAYKALWSRDKKVILEFRRSMTEIARRANLSHAELLSVAEPFGAFVETLERINNRQILKSNDREVWAAVGVKLEQTEPVIGRNPEQAKKLFQDAVAASMPLYGRDPQLDAFLRKAKKAPVSALPDAELRMTFDAFRELLAGISVF